MAGWGASLSGDATRIGLSAPVCVAPPLKEQIPTLPASVEEVVFKALSKEPKARFARTDDFAVALQAACQQRVVASPITPTLPPVPPSSSRAERPVSIEVPPTAPPPSIMAAPTEVPPNPRPLTPAAMSRAVQHGRVPNRHAFLMLLLVLLIALSGGEIYSFRMVTQWTPTLSPAQATARAAAGATATTAAQAYAEGTAKQGVMFGFDAAHTHNNPYEHTLSPANASQLKPLWSFPTGGEVLSSPVIADGMVYVGSRDKRLYAFDATCRNACQPLWSFLTGSDIYSSPAVAGGMVYIGSDDGKFYAFDAGCRNACQPLWNFRK